MLSKGYINSLTNVSRRTVFPSLVLCLNSTKQSTPKLPLTQALEIQRNIVKKYIFVFALYSQFSMAGDLVCDKKIAEIGNHAPGGLYIRQESGGLPTVKLCSFTEKSFRTSPEDCKQIASNAAMAYAMGKSFKVHVDGVDETSCGDIPNWTTLDVRYTSIK